MAGKLSGAVGDLGGNVDEALAELRVAAAVSDLDGIVRWQNSRWTELCGDCIGHPIGEHVAPESTSEWRLEFTKKVVGTARTSDYRINMIGPDGAHVPIEVSSVVIPGADHRVVGIFGTIKPVAPPFTPRGPAASLTPRQLEVLHHLDHGLSTTQIAERLHIQPETVRNHVRAILKALKVHSRLEAVAAARRRGLLAT